MPRSDLEGAECQGRGLVGPNPSPFLPLSISQLMFKMFEGVVLKLGEKQLCLTTKPHSSNGVND